MIYSEFCRYFLIDVRAAGPLCFDDRSSKCITVKVLHDYVMRVYFYCSPIYNRYTKCRKIGVQKLSADRVCKFVQRNWALHFFECMMQ